MRSLLLKQPHRLATGTFAPMNSYCKRDLRNLLTSHVYTHRWVVNRSETRYYADAGYCRKGSRNRDPILALRFW